METSWRKIFFFFFIEGLSRMNRLHKVGHLGDLLILVRRIKLLMWFVRHKVRPGHVVLSVVASIALSAPHIPLLQFLASIFHAYPSLPILFCLFVCSPSPSLSLRHRQRPPTLMASQGHPLTLNKNISDCLLTSRKQVA